MSKRNDEIKLETRFGIRLKLFQVNKSNVVYIDFNNVKMCKNYVTHLKKKPPTYNLSLNT